MKVAYIVSDQTACTLYRIIQPMEMAIKNKALAAKAIYERENPVVASELLAPADIIMMARATDGRLMEAIDGYQEMGKRIVMDYDDNMFACSPLSPHYGDLGTEEYYHDLNGERIPLWVDGKNGFSIEQNKKRLDNIREICRHVDAVTVTTPRLADAYRPYAKTIYTLPNCVDLSVWRKLPLRRESDEIRMGWSGGASHYEDWMEIAPVLPEVMKMFPKLKLVITGQVFAAALKGIPRDRIEIHKWAHVQAHPYKQAALDLDFAIIPLKDTLFNSGKSAIKWIEYAALEVPAVTSLVAPYDEVADVVKDNGVFVDNIPQAWAQGISFMVENEEARRLIAKNARQTVEQFYDANKTYSQWVSAFNQTLAYEPRRAKTQGAIA